MGHNACLAVRAVLLAVDQPLPVLCVQLDNISMVLNVSLVPETAEPALMVLPARNVIKDSCLLLRVLAVDVS